MANFRGTRLDNRNVKVYFLADDAAVAYTELATGSDFTGPRWSGTQGSGLAYENEGLDTDVPQSRKGTISGTIKLNHGVTRPVLRIHDYIYFIKVASDGMAQRVFVLITELDEGALSPNGMPQWTFSGTIQAEPDDIPAVDLPDWLDLTLPA